MGLNIKLFFASLIVLPIIDYFWLSNMLGFYLAQLGDLARKEQGVFQLYPAPVLVVYLVLAMGLVIFVLPQSQTLVQALAYGGAFGLVIYRVYDMTNLATLHGYTWRLSLVDIAWGTVLNAVASTLVFLLRERIA